MVIWENRGRAYEFSGQSWFGFLSEVDLGVLSPSCEIGMAVQCWCLGMVLRSRGLVGSCAGKVVQQSALSPHGPLSAWCRVSLVRRCFLPPDAAPHFVHLHHGAPGAVSLSCLGAPSVPESPPKRQVICECDRFFRRPCVFNRTGVPLMHGWCGRSRPSG